MVRIKSRQKLIWAYESLIRGKFHRSKMWKNLHICLFFSIPSISFSNLEQSGNQHIQQQIQLAFLWDNSD